MNTLIKQAPHYLLSLLGILGTSVFAAMPANAEAECPTWLNQDFKQLHKSNTINLCELTQQNPILIVNTASHCGFTRQLKTLEVIYQSYKDQGLTVVGFASDSFNQEADSEESIAEICYINYGVSFTMMAPITVKGEDAHPLFQHLASETQAPSWNFNKYLVSKDRQTITHMGSSKIPTPRDIEELL